MSYNNLTILLFFFFLNEKLQAFLVLAKALVHLGVQDDSSPPNICPRCFQLEAHKLEDIISGNFKKAIL